MKANTRSARAKAIAGVGCLVLLLSWISPFDDRVAVTIGLLLILLATVGALRRKRKFSPPVQTSAHASGRQSP